jgi:hypothetical protein
MLERWKSETEIVRKAVGNAVEPKNPIPVRELSMYWVDVEIVGCSAKAAEFCVI